MLIRSWSLIRSWRSEQYIKKVQHVSHACNNSHVLKYPMLCNCICILTGLYDKIHKNHKETEHMQSNTWSVNSCQGHNHFVSLWIIKLLRADLFMNNAPYKCCIITHCAVSHKDQIKKWYHRFIFHFFDLVEGGTGRWCVKGGGQVGGRKVVC